MCLLEGWEEVAKHLMGDETEDDLRLDLHITVEKTNYRMKIYPKLRLLWSVIRNGPHNMNEDVNEMNSIQVRFLEKINGEWKISFVSFIGTSGYGDMEETEEL